MPAKLMTFCYVHECKERLTQEFTVKQITGVAKVDDSDPTKIIYLRIKAFIPVDTSIETHIEEFSEGQVILLKGKFVANETWYTVNATAIKLLDEFDYDSMPAIGLNVMMIELTTKTVRNVGGKSVLEFYVEENLGNRDYRNS